jgi:hypothetical protein
MLISQNVTNKAATPAISKQSESWFRFFSRWSLFTGLVGLGLFLAFVIGVFGPNQNSRLSQDFIELVAASKNPIASREAQSEVSRP